MDDFENAKNQLIQLKKDYKLKCLNTAKIAYKLMKYTVDKIQEMEPIEIECGWDGTITVDGNTFFPGDLEE